MSDKQNNLNKDNDNIQFDTDSPVDEKVVDKPIVNKATAPLKPPEGFEEKPAPTKDASDEKAPKSEDPPRSPISESLRSLDKLPVTDVETIALPKRNKSTRIIKSRSKKTAPDKLIDEQPKEPAANSVKDTSGEQPAVTEPATTTASVDDEKPITLTPIKAQDQVDKSDTIKSRPADGELNTSAKSNTTEPEPTDTTGKVDEIPFGTSKDDTDANSRTYSRRPIIDDTPDKPPVLTFRSKPDGKPKKDPDTAVLPNESPSWRKVIDGQNKGTTSTFGKQHEVLFVIRGMIERVVMKDNSSVTLGRFDTGTIPNEEIDLIPYGAIDRGVSRRHCKIQLSGNQLYVTDLQSTNGTFLAGVRLTPDESTVLRKGDELLLGRLSVQVLFR